MVKVAKMWTRRYLAKNDIGRPVTGEDRMARVRRMNMNAQQARPDWRLIAVLICVIGLGRLALGLHLYPYGDDMVYGPLARLAADETLYIGDDQLRSFENHAWLYGLIWRAADATIGVVPAHLALTIGLTVLVGLTMLWIARAVGAAGWLIPLAFLVANVVEVRGIGRGAYGGAFGDHFHLQSLAIVFSLLAFLAVLRARWIWAGVALGLAALAQPVLAFHAAFAVGCLLLARGKDGVAQLLMVAVTSMIAAAPALLTLLDLEFGAVEGVERVIRDGYLWRADHHYQLTVHHYLLLGLYGTLGFLAVRRLGQGGGLIFGLAMTGALCWVFYTNTFGLQMASTLPYVLDFSRSSPLLWVLSSALAAAAAEIAWRSGDRISAYLIGIVVALILVVNFPDGLIAVVALAVSLFAIFLATAHASTIPAILAATGATAMIVSASTASAPLDRDLRIKAFYEWAREETPKDAMFIAPPFIADIRELAQRPVWVDFRAISLAQADQIMLSRERHELITPRFEDLPKTGGWAGARLWTVAYGYRHNAASIAALLKATNAAYFVTYKPDEPYELAGEGLKIAYADDHALVLELSQQ